MLPRNRWFVAAALAYALLGGLLGFAWLVSPGHLPAVALRSERLADAQFAATNVGLLAMVYGWLGGFPLVATGGGALPVAGHACGVQSLTLAGAALAWSALAIFAARLWPVLAPTRAAR